MAKAQVSRSAINASLWFMLGRSLGAPHPPEPFPDPAAEALDPEALEAVSQMLTTQGAEHLIETVLQTIGSAREYARRNPSATLSAKRYDQLRTEFLTEHRLDGGKGVTLWPVGGTTALKRAGGSWNAALAQAGLASSAKPTASEFGKARFTPEQFHAAIADFLAAAEHAGFATTYQGYIDWRADQRDQGRSDLPSGAAVRNSFGSWNAALTSVRKPS